MPSLKAQRLAPLAAIVPAIAAIALLLVAGPGSAAGAWHFRTGFLLLRIAFFLGLAGIVTGLIALVVGRRGGMSARLPALVAVIACVVAAAVPLRLRLAAKAVPPIHDITTDLEDPPRFEAVVPLRGEGTNPLDRGDPTLAERQQAAYPDVRPLVVGAPPAEAFDDALEAARSMGWDIVAEDRAAGRIEATDTTRWFGFKDDVVIRLRPESGGTRVDVRSVSRVGKSDAGANARRIRAFLDRLD